MATIFLVRHGLTDAVGRSLTGWMPGVYLNEEGQRQVAILSTELASVPFAAVFASPLERTMATAAAIAAPHGLAVESRESLGEVHWGEWTGKTLDEVSGDPEWRLWCEHPGEARGPGGESALEIQARMAAEISSIAKAYPDRTVALVSHGDPIRASVAYFLGMPIGELPRLEIDPASVSIVQIEAWGIRVKGVNLRFPSAGQ